MADTPVWVSVFVPVFTGLLGTASTLLATRVSDKRKADADRLTRETERKNKLEDEALARERSQTDAAAAKNEERQKKEQEMFRRAADLYCSPNASVFVDRLNKAKQALETWDGAMKDDSLRNLYTELAIADSGRDWMMSRESIHKALIAVGEEIQKRKETAALSPLE